MRLGAGAALVAASAVYAILVVSAAGKVGANYEEVVAYVLSPLDIRDGTPADSGSAPRFVTSPYLPRLTFEPTTGLRLPLLNQLYMTDHLSYGGVALAALGIDRLWAARLWHAAFGLALLWLLFDVALLLGLARRAAAIALAIAATSFHMTVCYAWARFDESLASFGTVAVLWAALRYSRDGGNRWLWTGVVAAALAVSGKVTALWPLSGLAVAGFLAGWRPPPLRALLVPTLATAPLLAPMVGFAFAGPATAGEVGRRLDFLGNLFTADVIVGTAANLIEYLGSWSSIASAVAVGPGVRAPNWAGRLLVTATLVWLVARSLVPGPPPRRRRRRLETQMIAFVVVVAAWVTLFFRERRDYQFLLLVPVHALAIAAFAEWCAARFLDRRLSAWVAGAIVCALPVASNLWEHRVIHFDLPRAHNPMADLSSQRASADWLVEHGVRQPIVITYYSVGTYEILSDGAVRPVYAFPLFRHPKTRASIPDYAAAWRNLLAEGGGQPHFVVLPLGENIVEATHFDEPAIRGALLAMPGVERAAVFDNPSGRPLLEVWRVVPDRPGAPG